MPHHPEHHHPSKSKDGQQGWRVEFRRVGRGGTRVYGHRINDNFDSRAVGCACNRNMGIYAARHGRPVYVAYRSRHCVYMHAKQRPRGARMSGGILHASTHVWRGPCTYKLACAPRASTRHIVTLFVL